MKNKKFTSKNLAEQIFKDVDNFAKVLEAKELQNLLPNILKILKLKLGRQKDYESVRVESATELSSENLENLKARLKVEDQKVVVRINKNITAGLRTTYKDISFDATFETMLKKLLTNTTQ